MRQAAVSSGHLHQPAVFHGAESFAMKDEFLNGFLHNCSPLLINMKIRRNFSEVKRLRPESLEDSGNAR
jgi:hypothetical protein